MKVSTIIALLVPVTAVMAIPMAGAGDGYADVDYADVNSDGHAPLEARSPQSATRRPVSFPDRVAPANFPNGGVPVNFPNRGAPVNFPNRGSTVRIAAAAGGLRRLCDNACDAGGEAVEAFCRTLPSGPVRQACWVASTESNAACHVFCRINFR